MAWDLDPIDRRILGLLQRDASLSTSEVASLVGLSQSPCWRRIERLETSGYILRRVALLDAHKLGLNMMVFAHVKLQSHGKAQLPQFEEAIRSMPEVVECYTVLGDTDYILRIVTRDLPAYEAFVREQLGQIASVQFTRSTIALSAVKSTTELPLELLG